MRTHNRWAWLALAFAAVAGAANAGPIGTMAGESEYLVVAAADTNTPAAATDDAGLEQAAAGAKGFGSYSPGAALGMGFAATLAPPLLAIAVDPIGGDSEFAWEAALALGVTAGVFAGPAIGLASGGRGDLARRGLLVRGIGLAGTTVGLAGIAIMFGNEEVSTGPMGMFLVGCAGALVTGISWIHDLAITPSAVARGRPPRTALGVRPDGKLAVTVRL